MPAPTHGKVLKTPQAKLPSLPLKARLAAGRGAALPPAARREADAAADVASYVTLGIESDVFAISVFLVREILDYRPMTRLPHAPDFLAGVIDVRGLTVPVVELRSRLGVAPTVACENTRILVLDLVLAGRSLVLGLLADRVFEVCELETQALEAAPDIGVRWNTTAITALARRQGQFVVVLNIPGLFQEADLAQLTAL